MSPAVLSTAIPFAHPLDPLSQQELRLAVSTVRDHVQTLDEALRPQRLLFNSVSLYEPSKVAVLNWAGVIPRDELPEEIPELVRQADVHILCPSGRAFVAVVDLPSNLRSSPGKASQSAKVAVWTPLDKDVHPSLQTEELLWAEEVCRKDEKVIAAMAEIGVTPENLYVDGWCVGFDERFPGRRLQQCFLFAKVRPGDNLYAHPIDAIPVIDSHTGEVLAIDFPPTNREADSDPHPPSSAAAYAKADPRARFQPPLATGNFMPDQLKLDDPDFKPREGLKPLHVLQPEGVSYRLEGRVLKWQNWSMHVGFNYREGLVLSNITYQDGANGTRPLFYRLSIAEMVVPYAKTSFPHHRKSAFDTGEYGLGALANSLALGCDCLGSISYLDFDGITRNGGIETIKSAVCIHEEDAGLLHKHTDFRTNEVLVARNRKLIISFICTVANYDYGVYINCSLDGSIEVEIKATGILNLYPLGPNEKAEKTREVEVAPRIVAQHHQHLFSLRVDPMIDGLKNQVVQVDSMPDTAPVGSDSNFYGNGFINQKTLCKTSKASVSDYESRTGRSWLIENPNKLHYSTGSPVGYKLVCRDMPPLLAQEGSMVWNRAPFARQNMVVTPYAEQELYPSDIHINQNPGGREFGLQNWVDRDEDIVNKDIVAWASFGMTHFARPEEYPIMPVEITRLHLKPVGFFAQNPALDVSGKKDTHSRNADEAVAAPSNCCSRS